VANLRARVRDGRLRVTVTGRLVAGDLRRLEHVCGPALEQRQLPLEVDLAGMSAMDEPARVFLERLARRGALVRLPVRDPATEE